jgi:hypothetical protein
MTISCMSGERVVDVVLARNSITIFLSTGWHLEYSTKRTLRTKTNTDVEKML